jgi:hypothetical protein
MKLPGAMAQQNLPAMAPVALWSGCSAEGACSALAGVYFLSHHSCGFQHP